MRYNNGDERMEKENKGYQILPGCAEKAEG